MPPVSPKKRTRRAAAKTSFLKKSTAALEDHPADPVETPDVMELLLDILIRIQAMEFYAQTRKDAKREISQETNNADPGPRSADGLAPYQTTTHASYQTIPLPSA